MEYFYPLVVSLLKLSFFFSSRIVETFLCHFFLYRQEEKCLASGNKKPLRYIKYMLVKRHQRERKLDIGEIKDAYN